MYSTLGVQYTYSGVHSIGSYSRPEWDGMGSRVNQTETKQIDADQLYSIVVPNRSGAVFSFANASHILITPSESPAKSSAPLESKQSAFTCPAKSNIACSNYAPTIESADTYGNSISNVRALHCTVKYIRQYCPCTLYSTCSVERFEYMMYI